MKLASIATPTTPIPIRTRIGHVVRAQNHDIIIGLSVPQPRLPGGAAVPLRLAQRRRSNEAMASMACQDALAHDPTDTSADFLLAALARRIDPAKLPKLRLPTEKS